MAPDSPRCYLVYALAPAEVSARDANGLFNEYIADEHRGLVVYHDHFIGRHGGLAIFDVRTDEQRALLDDPGPLAGWSVASHPLVFSQSAVGFAAQTAFTLEQYRGTSLAELGSAEEPSDRSWWQRA
jgi:hypothetical protein